MCVLRQVSALAFVDTLPRKSAEGREGPRKSSLNDMLIRVTYKTTIFEKIRAAIIVDHQLIWRIKSVAAMLLEYEAQLLTF